MQFLKNLSSVLRLMPSLSSSSETCDIQRFASSVIGRAPLTYRGLSTLTGTAASAGERGSLLTVPSLAVNPMRTNIRNNFPKPREVKRLRLHSLKTRLKTAGGRRIIINRILKGKHCLAHGW